MYRGQKSQLLGPWQNVFLVPPSTPKRVWEMEYNGFRLYIGEVKWFHQQEPLLVGETTSSSSGWDVGSWFKNGWNSLLWSSLAEFTLAGFAHFNPRLSEEGG